MMRYLRVEGEGLVGGKGIKNPDLADKTVWLIRPLILEKQSRGCGE